jgi:hypothetical protein
VPAARPTSLAIAAKRMASVSAWAAGRAGPYQAASAEVFIRHHRARFVFHSHPPRRAQHRLLCRLCQAYHNTNLASQQSLLVSVSDSYRDCQRPITGPDQGSTHRLGVTRTGSLVSVAIFPGRPLVSYRLQSRISGLLGTTGLLTSILVLVFEVLQHRLQSTTSTSLFQGQTTDHRLCLSESTLLCGYRSAFSDTDTEPLASTAFVS